MQFKGKDLNVLIPPPLRWRLGFGILGLLCVICSLKIWLSGSDETRNAVDAGRRLLIRLDDSTIEGKLLKAEDLQNAASHPATEAKQAQPQQQATEAAATTESDTSSQAVTLTNGPALPVTTMAADVSSSLSEEAKDGRLPVIAKDGSKPWRYYSKPYERKGGQPMIAIIVNGLGLNKAATDAVAHLSENITLSFSPYSKDLSTWALTARATGHEVLLDLPMEPTDFPASDPGPDALLTTNSPDINIARLNWVMSRMQSYIGVLSPQNEAFSANDEDYKLLLQSLANRGLMIVIGHEPAKNETKEVLDSTSTTNSVADVAIDEDMSASAIQSRLTALEELAKRRGYAIGIAQPLPVTIEQLRAWTETLNKKGLVLVPVTTITKQRFSS